jgi:hypothetical protein
MAQDEAQKWLSVTAGLLAEKAMPAKADFKTVTIQESSIHEPPCPL